MRVLSRTELGVALLLMGLLLFYGALLDARATGAQTGGGASGGTSGGTTSGATGGTTGGGDIAPGPDEGCPGAEVINTTTGSGNKQSQIFDISGDSFRITTNVQPTSDPQNVFFDVDVRTADDEPVTNIDPEAVGTDSSIVNAGPGRFFIDVASANANYTVVVENCVRSAQNGSTNGNGDTNGGGNTDGDANDDGVIDNTIPKKPLPDTGGSTALMVGGSALLLLYGSLVAWRLKTRER